MAFRPEIDDFGAFYERTYQVAYRTALGIVRNATVAADITQEAYVAAYEHRSRFRGDAPGQAWLHRIVVNQALAALRRHRPAVREVSLPDPGRPDDAPGATDRLVLFAALDELSPRHRAAIVLRYYHDYDYATIARILDTSPTNVGAMLSRALDRLRVTLEADFPRDGRGGLIDVPRTRFRQPPPGPPPGRPRPRVRPGPALGRVAGGASARPARPAGTVGSMADPRPRPRGSAPDRRGGRCRRAAPLAGCRSDRRPGTSRIRSPG